MKRVLNNYAWPLLCREVVCENTKYYCVDTFETCQGYVKKREIALPENEDVLIIGYYAAVLLVQFLHGVLCC